jgi:hypothetical protein
MAQDAAQAKKMIETATVESDDQLLDEVGQ